MKIKFASMYGEFGKLKVKSYNKHCDKCGKMIDEYEYIRCDGMCEICYYNRHL